MYKGEGEGRRWREEGGVGREMTSILVIQDPSSFLPSSLPFFLHESTPLPLASSLPPLPPLPPVGAHPASQEGGRGVPATCPPGPQGGHAQEDPHRGPQGVHRESEQGEGSGACMSRHIDGHVDLGGGELVA